MAGVSSGGARGGAGGGGGSFSAGGSSFSSGGGALGGSGSFSSGGGAGGRAALTPLTAPDKEPQAAACVLVLGPSRGGKTTLLRALLPGAADGGGGGGGGGGGDGASSSSSGGGGGGGATTGCHMQVLPIEVDGEKHYVQLLEVGGDESYRDAARLAYFTLPVHGILVVVDDSLPPDASFGNAQAALEEYARFRGHCADARLRRAAAGAPAAARAGDAPDIHDAVAAIDIPADEAVSPAVAGAVCAALSALPMLVVLNKRDAALQLLPFVGCCRRGRAGAAATDDDDGGGDGAAALAGFSDAPPTPPPTAGTLSRTPSVMGHAIRTWRDVCLQPTSAAAVGVTVPLQIEQQGLPWYRRWLARQCRRFVPLGDTSRKYVVTVKCATATAREGGGALPNRAIDDFLRRVVARAAVAAASALPADEPRSRTPSVNELRESYGDSAADVSRRLPFGATASALDAPRPPFRPLTPPAASLSTFLSPERAADATGVQVRPP